MCSEGGNPHSIEVPKWSKSKGPRVYFKLNSQGVLGVLDKSSFNRLMGTEQCIEKQGRRDEVGSVRGDNSYTKFCSDILIS